MPDTAALLAWYDRHRRPLPWREGAIDPYHVLLSEIMLQQTTVATVRRRFGAFLARFPTLASLAAASEEAVIAAWAGLGYYARARSLHRAAQRIAREGFPATLAGWRALPGIGDYTAASIGAIAFGLPVVPVDANAERVIARVGAITEPLEKARARIRAAARRFAEQPAMRARAGDFAQALFDLGAVVCTQRVPACALCPWSNACAARARGIAAALPRKISPQKRPLRHGVHFWLIDSAGQILLRRRPAQGLLGGTMELPGTPWRIEPWNEAEALALAPMPASWRPAGRVRHSFTHFVLEVVLYAAQVPRFAVAGLACPLTGIETEGLSSLMRKCALTAGSGFIAGPSRSILPTDPNAAAG